MFEPDGKRKGWSVGGISTGSVVIFIVNPEKPEERKVK